MRWDDCGGRSYAPKEASLFLSSSARAAQWKQLPLATLLSLILVSSTVAASQSSTRSGSSQAVEQPGASVPGVPTCPTNDVPSGWKTYVNSKYRFCLSYPPSYAQNSRDVIAKNSGDDMENRAQLLKMTDEGRLLQLQDARGLDAAIWVEVETETWDLNALTKYAPMGQETPPEPRIIGGQVFYYYGPGGGGVCYPDQFFYDLRGKPLSILFLGPCVGDKTPDAATKNTESQILGTFRAY